MLGPDEREFLIQFRRSLRGLEIAIDRYFQATDTKSQQQEEPVSVTRNGNR